MVPAVYKSMDNPEDFGEEFRERVSSRVVVFLSFVLVGNFLLKMPSGDHCCVPQCLSDRRKETGKVVLFHVFPQTCSLRRRWIHAIRRDVGKAFQIRRNTCVCSNHFVDGDYCGKEKRRSARLKRDSVPSVFPWTRVA